MAGDSRRKGYRASLTPEEIIAIQFRAKCRFKAAVRFVMANLYWLSDVEDEELGQDVQKNVKLLTRKFRKDKGLLRLTDKAILNQAIECRTEEVKNHLYKVIGGLKCFRRYPNHVKSQLAAVTYFVYYGPGRTIVREGDEAHALYFLITGDVEISQLEFDPVTSKSVKVEIVEMGPGGMFGEVSLLHNIPRAATVNTINHCELLKLKRHDFNVVLKTTVQEQWNEVKRAMKKFTYFDEWDEIAIRECCIMAKMKSYKPDDTILGDGRGLQDYTYFLLKGKCRMIEHVQVVTQFVKGIKRYKLYEVQSSASFAEKRKSESASAVGLQSKLKIQASLDSITDRLFKSSKIEKESMKFTKTSPYNTIETRMSSVSTTSKKKIGAIQDGSGSFIEEAFEYTVEDETSSASDREIRKGSIVKGSKATVKGSKDTIEGSTTTMEDSKTRIASKVTIASDENLNDQEYYYMSLLETPEPSKLQTVDVGVAPELIFMQVCFFNPTACFGIGENLKNRRVVAMTPVDCLLVPRYWLMQRNKGNIWNLVQHILNHLPTTKQLFKEYVNHKKWLAYRKNLVDGFLAKSKIPCENNYSNIPYSIRLNENIDFP